MRRTGGLRLHHLPGRRAVSDDVIRRNLRRNVSAVVGVAVGRSGHDVLRHRLRPVERHAHLRELEQLAGLESRVAGSHGLLAELCFLLRIRHPGLLNAVNLVVHVLQDEEHKSEEKRIHASGRPHQDLRIRAELRLDRRHPRRKRRLPVSGEDRLVQNANLALEPFDLAALFDAMKRMNTIQIDMNRDFWQYISMEYFKQQIKAGEVGSSAMPHKVNPIDFENAEGNLGMANAILEHLARKLPVSRLQRDLTDSTVIRNIGVPFGHQMIAIASSLKGLGKLLINEQKIAADLDGCWSVVAEAIQTILRREGYPHPYEALKALTRTNSQVTQQSISEFIDGLNVNDNIKQELKAIAPGNYFGV